MTLENNSSQRRETDYMYHKLYLSSMSKGQPQTGRCWAQLMILKVPSPADWGWKNKTNGLLCQKIHKHEELAHFTFKKSLCLGFNASLLTVISNLDRSSSRTLSDGYLLVARSCPFKNLLQSSSADNPLQGQGFPFARQPRSVCKC